MQKSALQVMLKRISEGDMALVPKLCSKLADRLVYIPVLEVKNEGTNRTKVSVIRIREGSRALVPIFTAQPILKSWLSLNGIKGDGMSLLCADVCTAVEKGTWMMVDAGTDYWIELEPSNVQKIAETEIIINDTLEEDSWSMRSKTEKKVSSHVEDSAVSASQEKPIYMTQEVPIVPHPMTMKNQLNPSEGVSKFSKLGPMGKNEVPEAPAEQSGGFFKRFRQRDDDDRRATMDLTAFKKKAQP